jgi:hypothetical protein
MATSTQKISGSNLLTDWKKKKKKKKTHLTDLRGSAMMELGGAVLGR